ncbi:calcium-binding mitochondrial carrier protein Aralar1 isoform X2 [Halyomorpha halys]|uniref:calcium-binding mitochondrial carrier protein Aralar1 isoform X2 n=1 Tax=Halyomorpha halys TaxID=286706 RepID=UPI0006D4EB25|nr:calcium-binding mitochondrial carrier protein Aralar1 isoform X2 [Halyomorpha halys]
MVIDLLKNLFLEKASCFETTGSSAYPKRASTEALHEIFLKHASTNVNGEWYMNGSDFIRGFLGLFPNENFNESSVRLLAGIVDTSKDGLISFAEFQAFEGLLCVPDALYRTAFQLFDIKGKGVITFNEFSDVIQKTELNQRLPFDMDNEFIKLYFGNDKKRSMSYAEFSQFLHDFHEECGTQAFKKFDKDGTGFISVLDFQDIMISIKNHLLTKQVQDNLVGVAASGEGGSRVSFPFFMAFNSLLSNMELVKRVYLNASNGSHTQELTKDELLYQAQMMSQITPLEIDILFNLCHLIHQRGRVAYSDLQSIAPEQYHKQLSNRITEIHAVSSPEERSTFISVLENVYRFSLGAIAGATGAAAVYPIDLVKTRMQNQRIGSFIGEVMYKNSFDCFRKVVRHEGVLGLYRGMLPQMVGVSPEKALKLTTNDFVRDHLMDKDGNIPIWGEIVAGGCGGCAQVIFTNPLEIVKIRLQVAGEIASQAKVSALAVVKELGFFGLYKGARSCFLRDICFSAIYFPTYAHVKAALADENGYNQPYTLFLSGLCAGVPAASLVTPADVVKTRLQVAAREGQTSYNGMVDAFRKIYREEGFRAFWKGAGARVVRSSPQFGFTLITYELLQRYLYIDFGGTRPAGSEVTVPSSGAIVPQKSVANAEHIGGYQAAIPILTGIETKFGLSLPKFSMATIKQKNTQ